MGRGIVVRVLLDTTILIDILRGETRAIAKIDELRSDSALYTTTLNIYEVLRGIKTLQKDKEKHLNALNILISNINIIDFGLSAAERASEIYSELRKKGAIIDSIDYLIAGTCISNGIYVIITRNDKHFENIKELKEVITY